MQKIKAIQKGEDIYFSVVPNSPATNQVDEIKVVKAENKINNKGIVTEFIIMYHGYKNNKLVFSMTNNDLIIWYESE